MPSALEEDEAQVEADLSQKAGVSPEVEHKEQVEDEVEVGESTRCSSSCELELACMRTYGVRCRMTKASCID